MAQEFDQEQMGKQMPEGYVKPQDNVTVYATDKAPYHAVGEPVVMHRTLAAKLVTAGKMTETAPKADKKA